jgi:uncharacterized protein (TIGR03437 family)
MKASCKNLWGVFLLLAAAGPLEAADLLFAFRADAATAAVYEADSLRLLANPAVGLGARQVFGVPGADLPHGFAKFFVVGREAVVVLDGDFRLRRTLALSAPAAAGPGAAVLVAAGERLLVAAGREIVVISTVEERVVASVPLNFTARALAALPHTPRVLVLSEGVLGEGSTRLRQLDLETYRIEESVAMAPQALTGVAAAPSGGWVYGVAGDSFYDLRAVSALQLPAALEALQPASAAGADSGALLGARQPEATRAMAIADTGRYVMVSGGRIYHGWLSGSSDSTELSLSRDALPASPAAGGIALSADGRRLYAASSASELLRIDLDHPAEPQSAALSFEPSALALLSPHVGQAAGMLEQVSPLQQRVAGGRSFSLEVKAVTASGAPQSGVVVFASSFTPAIPAIECFSNVTGPDGTAALFCTADQVTAATLVRVTVSDTSGRSAPSFEVSVIRPTETEGLAKKSGDFAVVPEEADFQLTVSASENRVPQANLGLVISSVPTRPTVTCPPQVFTNANGEATITCSSGVVTVIGAPKVPVEVKITLTDGSRSVVFSVTIDPNQTLQEGLAIISGNAQRVALHSDVPLPLVVRSVIDGVPQVDQSLAISVHPPRDHPALVCPAQVFTDEDGFGYIRCRGGVVFGEETITVTVGGPRGSQVQFQVIVRATPQGTANDLEILTVDPIEAVAGEVRQNAVRVIATAGPGQRVAGKLVYFFSEDGATFDPPSVVTDGFGEATTTVTFGCADRNRGTIEVGFADGEPEDDIDFRLTPGTFARIDKLQGDNQVGAPGQTLSSAALLVQVGDLCGNPLTQQKVNWRVHPSPRATFRNLVDTTNQSGRSSVLVQLGSYGGPFSVTAQAGEVTATFNLGVAMDPSQLKRLSGDDQIVAPGAISQPLVVETTGTNGFGVSGVDVTFSVTQGTATLTRQATKSDGLGVAYTAVQMGDGGPVTVTASAFGQSVSFTLRSGAGGGPQAPLEGFVNGASFRAGWVPGSLGTIFGTGITGVNGVVTGGQVPFPTTLEGVSVTVNGIPAPIISLINSDGTEQINLQVPFGIPAGTATVVINNNGSELTVADVPILSAQPGIFEFFLGEARFAAALHADFNPVTPDNPALPGEVLLLFLTGLGTTNPAVATNAPGPVPAAATALTPVVGFDSAGVEHFGGYYAPTLVTAYQINFRVPLTAQPGDHEINVVVDGVSSQRALLAVGSP